MRDEMIYIIGSFIVQRDRLSHIKNLVSKRMFIYSMKKNLFWNENYTSLDEYSKKCDHKKSLWKKNANKSLELFIFRYSLIPAFKENFLKCLYYIFLSYSASASIHLHQRKFYKISHPPKKKKKNLKLKNTF